MTQRKSRIIANANAMSAIQISAAEARPKVSANLDLIRGVCESLVIRQLPLAPTVPLVAERGRIKHPHFPSEQTLYNAYRDMIRLWRRAYDDILDLDAPERVTEDDLDKIDVTHFPVGDRIMVQDLIVIAKEEKRRNKAYAALIAKMVPTAGEAISESADRTMTKLMEWLVDMKKGSFFDLDDDLGLRVSRRTPVRATIMGAELFNELVELTGDYANASRRRAA